jgi:hypothetical protein
VSICLYTCTTTDDCPNLYQVCFPGAFGPASGCFLNFCGYMNQIQDFPGPFFGTCPVLDDDDGQCLEFGSFPNNGAYCYQNGTANVGEPCNLQFRFGAFSECGYGNYCVPNAAADGGLCFPITIDGGCSPGDDAVPLPWGADWAICAADCTTSMNCDGGFVGTSCQPVDGGATTMSACLP